MLDKRPRSPDLGESNGGTTAGALVKRQKSDGQQIIGTVTKEGFKRTSNLHAPIMQLSGHAGEVFTVQFSPDGEVLASGSYDRTILLWRTFSETCENYMMLRGHKNAVLELHWTPDGERIVSCSADKSVRCWDVQAGVQVKRLTEHKSFVNSCCPLRRGPPLVVSGGDDAVIKLWDLRQKKSVQTLVDSYAVTAVAFADDGDQVYSGGLDGEVKAWELRRSTLGLSMEGHGDTVTGLRVSPDGTHLLSNAMDNTLRVWDVRPYAPANRCTKVLVAHTHNFEKTLLRCDWSPDGRRITAGSADRVTYVWDANTRAVSYALPGHKGSVNEAVFHPTEPIIASGSSDRTIFLGEIAPLAPLGAASA